MRSLLSNWRSRVADALVLWPERALGGRSSASQFGGGGNLRESLAKRLAELYPYVPREDVDAAVETFDVGEHAAFPAWIGLLTEELELAPKLAMGGGGPEFASAQEPAASGRVVLGVRNYKNWLAAATRYDLDCMLTYGLARRSNLPLDDSGWSWGVVCDLWSHELETLLQRGVADMHVHWGGSRHANLLWLRFLTSGLERDALPALKRLFDQPARGEQEPPTHRLVRNILGSNRIDIVAEIADRVANAERRRPSPQALLNAERRALVGAWREVIGPDASRESPDAIRQLDRYFNAKCAFLSLVRQPPQSRPGLQEFRGYFDASRTKDPRQRAIARSGRDLDDILNVAEQDRRLRRMELRMGPRENVNSYDILLRLHARRPHLSTRFCVHFMRSMNRIPGANARERWRRFHTELARQAAVFHAYRVGLANLGDQASLQKLALIPRIDVAGQERDNPPENFAFVMRLLRGDAEAWACIKNNADEKIYAPWSYLPGPDQRPLPLLHASCHAGEDYFHAADGLAAIDAAVEGLGLADGDSLGHALALGAFDEHGVPLGGAPQFAPTGRQFDVLLWLHEYAITNDAPGEEIGRIERELGELWAFGGRRPAAWSSFHKLLGIQRGPILAGRRSADRCEIAFRRQHHSVDVAEARMKQRPISDVFDNLRRTLGIAREKVARKVSERGVIVEINPSSNLRVSGALSSGDWTTRKPPSWALLNLIRRYRSDIRFVIGTDDPGIFSTSIASEFALLFHFLLENDWSRTDACDFLDRCRATGVNALP